MKWREGTSLFISYTSHDISIFLFESVMSFIRFDLLRITEDSALVNNLIQLLTWDVHRKLTISVENIIMNPGLHLRLH